MQQKIKFEELDRETQIDIIRTLFHYDACHLHHANGKTLVMTSYCLKAHYADDEWISQEFKREDLGMNDRDSMSPLWIEMTRQWVRMTKEEKENLRAAFDIIEQKTAEAILEWRVLG